MDETKYWGGGRRNPRLIRIVLEYMRQRVEVHWQVLDSKTGGGVGGRTEAK